MRYIPRLLRCSLGEHVLYFVNDCHLQLKIWNKKGGTRITRVEFFLFCFVLFCFCLFVIALSLLDVCKFLTANVVVLVPSFFYTVTVTTVRFVFDMKQIRKSWKQYHSFWKLIVAKKALPCEWPMKWSVIFFVNYRVIFTTYSYLNCTVGWLFGTH